LNLLRRHVPPPSDHGLGTNTAVPGMQVHPDAVSSAAAAALLAAIDRDDAPWVNIRTRWTKDYGPPFDFRSRVFGGPLGPDGRRRPPPVPDRPLPPYAHAIVLPALRLFAPGLADWTPNQLSVNRYEAGAGHTIAPHNDNEGGGLHTAVVGMCLGAAATMTFVRPPGIDGAGTRKRDVRLPSRCVYVMSGEAFAVWRHAIFAPAIAYGEGVEDTRVSVTLREVAHRGRSEGDAGVEGNVGVKGAARGGGEGRGLSQRPAGGRGKGRRLPRGGGPMDAFARPSRGTGGS